MAQVVIAQSINDTAGGNPSLTGVTSGNVLVLAISAGRYFGLAPDITAVSGGTGGTWTRRTNATNSEAGAFLFECIGNTASTVTTSLTGSYDEAYCTLYELTNGSAFDVAAQNSAASGTAQSSGATATLASDEDLAIGCVTCETGFSSYTPGGGYTEDHDYTSGYTASASHLEVTSTTGTTASYTCTTSAPWAAGVITIKPAGGGGGGPTVKTLAALGVG